MVVHPIAEHPDEANAQHYELPPDFFQLALGPRRKYSCCLYRTGNETLAQAEECALAETAAHADLRDGQEILELGCGWGSLSLWMAERFPNARITAVSNSRPQREFIEREAMLRQLRNLTIVTADMNDFTIPKNFDRVVSIEMFEHMANWQTLLARVRTWLKPDGRLFIHVFSHDRAPYRFDHGDANDWIAQYFFTGGIMPSRGLIHRFPDLFTVEQEWRWSGSITAARRLTGSRITMRMRARSAGSFARSMAATPDYGAAAGACSSSRPPRCSDTTKGGLGASAIIACARQIELFGQLTQISGGRALGVIERFRAGHCAEMSGSGVCLPTIRSMASA